MTLRFSTTRALGAAIVLTLGSASLAMAQQSTTSGTRVRKDVAPSSTSSSSGSRVTKDVTPAPATTTPTTTDTMSTSTSTTVTTPAPTPTPVMTDTTSSSSSMSTTTTSTTTTTSAGEVPGASLRPMRNGWYIGVAGAGVIPQNGLRDYYKTGWGVEVPIGWDPVNSPLGLRLNLGYNRLTGKSGFRTVGTTTGALQSLEDPQIFQAVGDAKLRLPFGKGLLSGLYAVGGGGLYYFKNYTNTLNLTTNPGTAGGSGSGASGGNVTNTFSASDKSRFGANVGGGIQFGVGNAALYVESRYVRIFTPNRDSDYVPVALGLTFNW